jgi:hypothetical protein
MRDSTLNEPYFVIVMDLLIWLIGVVVFSAIGLAFLVAT